MQVTFARIDQRRYAIAMKRDGPRDIGPDLPFWPGPGSGQVPHDLVHFIVEEQLGLRLGIFGQAAAGGGMKAFVTVERTGTARRRSERLRIAGRPDMRRSEKVASCVGTGGLLRPDLDQVIGNPVIARAFRHRLEQVLGDWERVPIGGFLTLTWPMELTVRHARAGGRHEAQARPARHL